MSYLRQKRVLRFFALSLVFALSFTLFPVSTAGAAVPMMADEFELAYRITQNLKEGETTTEFRFRGGDPDYARLMDLIRMTYPCQFTLHYYLYQSDTIPIKVTVVPDHEKYQSQQEAMAQEVVNAIIRPNMTDREKIKTIHDWIILNTTYDREATDGFTHGTLPYTAYYLFAQRLAVCAGYADAFTLMARAAGLLALTVNGFATPNASESVGHAWNMVLAEGSWKYIDCTWDDPDQNDRIRYDYFLLSEKSISKDHYWDVKAINKFLQYILPHRPDYAETLRRMSLFKGMDGDPQLDAKPDRAQAAVMMVRLFGAENEAQNGIWPHPFTDGIPGWATKHVGWLYARHYTNGTSAASFSPSEKVTLNQYLTFILRAMGYTDGIDFQYASASDFALRLGMLTQYHIDALKVRPFLRADMVNLSYAALGCAVWGSRETLLDRLVSQGAVGALERGLYQKAA